jgi:hypothetical protein
MEGTEKRISELEGKIIEISPPEQEKKTDWKIGKWTEPQKPVGLQQSFYICRIEV